MQIAKHLRGGTGRTSTEIEKIGDIVMALRLEREFPREQLLLSYVNMPYFGRGSYGIEAASRAYFDKPAADLALYQVAFIVSLINKPALPDRSFAMDPLLKTRDEIMDANWSEAARSTLRVLGLMLEQGAISEVDVARATSQVEKSLRKEIVAPWRACGVRDHFLERVRVLYKDRFPINTGGLTISITRDDALQDVLAKAVDLTLHSYVARHPDDPDNNLLRAGAFAVDFSGDVLAEVGNVNFKDLKYDIMASGWRQPGSTFKIFTYGALVERLAQAGACREALRRTRTGRRVAGPRALQRARRADLRVARARPRREEDRELPLAIGTAVPRRDHLPDSPGRVAQHGGDARRGQRGYQERHRSCVSPGHSEGPEARTSTLPDDGNRRFGGQPALDGLDCCVRQRRFSRHAALRQRRLPRGKSLLRTDSDNEPADCDVKGEKRPQPERVMHPVVAAAMTELLKGSARHRLDGHCLGTAQRRHSRDGSPGRRDLEAET